MGEKLCKSDTGRILMGMIATLSTTIFCSIKHETLLAHLIEIYFPDLNR